MDLSVQGRRKVCKSGWGGKYYAPVFFEGKGLASIQAKIWWDDCPPKNPKFRRPCGLKTLPKHHDGLFLSRTHSAVVLFLY